MQKWLLDQGHYFAMLKEAGHPSMANDISAQEFFVMGSRMNYAKAAPGAMRAMNGLETYLENCGLEPALQDLVKLRASQINGCAYCVDMHSLDARANGETEQRLYALSVWQEAPFFSERERAALLWTEKLTAIAVDHVPDAVYEQARRQFNEEELANLTLVIATINAWNRFGISFRDTPGRYTPAKREQ
jgi:AhpD family alkylhydroperoxidase